MSDLRGEVNGVNWSYGYQHLDIVLDRFGRPFVGGRLLSKSLALGGEVRNMESHFVCSANCGGMSDHMKACETDACPMKGEMMKECHCTDGKHAEVIEKTD